MTVLTPTQMIAEIVSNMPDNTTGLITPAIARATFTDMVNCGSGLRVANVLDFGAKGDGVTDDTTAIDNALGSISSAGGGTLFFPKGNFLMNQDTLTPPSNTIIQGAGVDATTITNTCTIGAKDCVVTVVMTMTGGSNAGLWTANNTTYPINAPTPGTKTVTTTTAANAGNFAAGNIIMVSGGFGSTAFWFPSWYTTVVSANAGTGVITLAENLPFGGSGITTVQKIISLPKNIVVRDMTLAVNSNIGGFSGSILQVLGCEQFLAENLKFVNLSGLGGASCAIGAPTRRSGFRNCHMTPGAGPMELFGASESFIEGCTVINSYFLMDGGTMDSTFINNHCKDPQKADGTTNSFHGLHIPDYATRNKIIGSSFIGIPNTFAGVNVSAGVDSNRNHTIVGCTFQGTGSGSGTGVNTSDGIVANCIFSNLAQGIQLQSTESAMISDNYFDLAFPCGANILPFSGASFFRRTGENNFRSLTSGVAIPQVAGEGSYQIFNGSAQTITNFSGGKAGDKITIMTGDANTTFANGSGLTMKGGVNYNPVANIVLTFMATSGSAWIECSRSA